MQQPNQLCNLHQQPITNMCIENHTCEDRRLCVQCMFKTHKGINLQDSAPLVDDFQNLLKIKLDQYQEDNFKPFLHKIETIQSQMNQYFMEIKKQVNCLIDQIKEIGKQIISLKQKVSETPILEFSRSDYNLMVDIINKNIIKNNIEERNQYKNECNNQIQRLSDQCKQFNEQLTSMTVEIIKEEFERDVQIQGLQLFGLKHGDYYYINQNGTKTYAGQYSFGLKTGHWNDYLGFDKILNKKIYKERIYLFGIDLGLKRNRDAKFKQLLRKDGEWVESEGKWCNIVSQGYYNEHVKVGEWKDTFDGQICGNGLYNEYGQKHGRWMEPIDKFNNNCQVTYSGEYQNGIRVGQWITTYKKDIIGGGTYNERGVKMGDWTELHENFQDSRQITYCGEYKNGLKVGQWITTYEKDKIGGGTYDEKGVKIGNWTELHEYFQGYRQVTYSGEYLNGLKVGQWTTTYKKDQIGGGTYNDKGVKIGNWIELHENFYDYRLVTYSGEYLNGLKVGQWITTYQKDRIGGGTYDDKGVKIGNWTELHENFYNYCLMTYSGEYKNGLKVGQWITTYEQDKIGGGTYDDKGVKIGNWTEIHENFQDYFYVTYSGEYKNGLKVGQWITTYQKDRIGGGTYDDKGVKIGDWTELHENFDYFRQVKYSGEYKNGLKVGKWITTYDEYQIGGGTYNDKGVKIGNWTEIHENFYNQRQVKYSGEYKNGLKVGQWITTYKNDEIGGGTYDDKGVKIGNWTELHENFDNYCQVKCSGEYKNGLKVGQWITTYEKDKIGGGTYDDKGVKIGNWTEIHEIFNDSRQVTYSGEYKNGLKVGKWITTYDEYKIYGGTYDDKGVKIGNWTEIHENFNNMTYSGEYKNGLKVGQWITTQRNNKIGGGTYDDKGVKIGNWTEIHENFNDMTYSGEYKNGLKVGQWITNQWNNKIGGTYDDKGVKIGNWTEIHENFYNMTYSGEYKNGLKVGEWITTYYKDKIGGGTYDDKGVKIGNWTEIHENLYNSGIMTQSGECKNGVKVGQWITTYKKDKIGGGTYDDKGVKIGNWTELHENFHNYFQMTYSGEYKNGLKVGQWITTYYKDKIGGGTYDDKGVKIGNWTELHEHFYDSRQVTYSGEYKNGLKVGQWITIYKKDKIGGGTYDDKGVKIGNWTELHENFDNSRQVTYSGEYQNGLKVGYWTKKYLNEV